MHAVLARAKDFLVQMKGANEELKARMNEQGSASVSIEEVAEDAPHIEMVRVDVFPGLSLMRVRTCTWVCWNNARNLHRNLS